MNTTNKMDWNAEVAQAVLAMKGEGQKAYTYMKSEAPEIAREYVRWKVVEQLSYAAGWLFAIGVLFALGRYCFKKHKEQTYSDDPWFIGACGAWFFSLMMLPAIIPHICAAMKCFVAPRIVIIEGIKSIVR